MHHVINLPVLCIVLQHVYSRHFAQQNLLTFCPNDESGVESCFYPYII